MKNKFLSFDSVFLSLSTLILCVSALLLKSDIITVMCAILGIAGSVINASGRKTAYFVSLASSLMYIYISFRACQYGETLLHMLCVSPLYVYSIIKWYRPGNKNDTGDCFRLKKKQIIIMLSAGVVITVIYGFLLKYAGRMIGLETSFPFLNSASTALCISAYILSAKRMREMWISHLGANCVLIAMWFLASGTETGAMLIMIENILFIICNVRGLIIWNRLSAQNKPDSV